MIDGKLILRRIRRRFLVIFRPYYVMRSLSLRRGNCNHCSCCEKINCKHLENKLCKIYPRNPLFCMIFPIDEKEREIVKKHCGFYWEK